MNPNWNTGHEVHTNQGILPPNQTHVNFGRPPVQLQPPPPSLLPPPYHPPPPAFQPPAQFQPPWNTSVPTPTPRPIFPPNNLPPCPPPFHSAPPPPLSGIPSHIYNSNNSNNNVVSNTYSFNRPIENYSPQEQISVAVPPTFYQGQFDRPSIVNYNKILPENPTFSDEAKPDQSHENEQEWVKDWLRKLNKGISVSSPSSQNKILHLPNVKMMLKESLKLWTELNQIHSQLSDGILSSNEDLWNYRLKRALRLKDKLQEIQEQLFSNKEQLICKMKHVCSKRRRIKSKKQSKKELFLIEKQKRNEINKQLDLWQEGIYEEDKQREREKKLKEEADTILSEVRKKQAEAKRNLELIQSLQKLRDLRKTAVERKGLYTTKESDNNFNGKMLQMETMFLSQLDDYKAEEKALRVILESSREAEEQQCNDQFNKQIILAHNQLLQCLFGDVDPPPPDDPNYMLWTYYMQSENDLNGILRIRQEWDRYLVPENMPLGSSIPPTWVYPSEPSSEQWGLVLSSNPD